MLSKRNTPKSFLPEAVNWAVHVLNRSPTLVVKNATPEEAWSGVKTYVDHFRIFGCVSHVHVPNKTRTKLDDKSLNCVLLGVSEEAKAYRLYYPISKRIIISKDVVFEENERWVWDKKYQKDIACDLEWGDDEKEEVHETLELDTETTSSEGHQHG